MKPKDPFFRFATCTLCNQIKRNPSAKKWHMNNLPRISHLRTEPFYESSLNHFRA